MIDENIHSIEEQFEAPTTQEIENESEPEIESKEALDELVDAEEEVAAVDEIIEQNEFAEAPVEAVEEPEMESTEEEQVQEEPEKTSTTSKSQPIELISSEKKLQLE